jgi:hypothetical protein
LRINERKGEGAQGGKVYGTKNNTRSMKAAKFQVFQEELSNKTVGRGLVT